MSAVGENAKPVSLKTRKSVAKFHQDQDLRYLLLTALRQGTKPIRRLGLSFSRAVGMGVKPY